MSVTLEKTDAGYKLVVTKSVTETLDFANLDDAVTKLRELEANQPTA